MKRAGLILTLLVVLFVGCTEKRSDKIITTDVLIVGGGASGTTAGIQAARLGVRTIIVEEFDWLGGMLTSAGVSAIDGNYNLPSGLWEEFRQELYKHYGGAEKLNTGWVSNVLFEPSVADSILKAMVVREETLQVKYGSYPFTIEKQNNGWLVSFHKKGGEVFHIQTEIVIDATELGDLAKMAGIPCRIGMDAKSLTGEDIALNEALDIIQDLTYVAILKDYGSGMNKTIEKPENYIPEEFLATCSGMVEESDRPLWTQQKMMEYGKLPNGKFMINWPIYGNDYYLNIIEMSREERTEAIKAAKLHTLRYIYYLQNELGYKNLGLADDEFPTDDNLPFMPYFRESRRIVGEVLFTLNHIAKPYDQTDKLYRTGIAVGDYPVDHHHSAYSLEHEFPDLHFYPVPSYALPLGSLIPREINNFIVAEKSISVSNIVNGTTRLQPVCLLIGQAAGILAANAVLDQKTPGDISVRKIQTELLEASAYIQPYIDVKPEDTWFNAVQKVGATGILRSVGKNKGWTNETYFYPDSLVKFTEIQAGIKEIFPSVDLGSNEIFISLKFAIELVTNIAREEQLDIKDNVIQQKINKALLDAQSPNLKLNEKIDRKTFALILDAVIDVFELRDINLKGEFIN